jgi:hypothetical protein
MVDFPTKDMMRGHIFQFVGAFSFVPSHQSPRYEEKSKHAGLTHQNGFGPAFLHKRQRLVKGTAKPKTRCQLAR